VSTGFCMGGRLAFLTACVLASDIAAAVPFYGGQSQQGRFSGQTLVPHRPGGQDPLPDDVNFGERDAFIPWTRLEDRGPSSGTGQAARSKCIPEPIMGTCAATGASYHAQAAKESWEKMVGFLASTKVGNG